MGPNAPTTANYFHYFNICLDSKSIPGSLFFAETKAWNRGWHKTIALEWHRATVNSNVFNLDSIQHDVGRLHPSFIVLWSPGFQELLVEALKSSFSTPIPKEGRESPG